MDRDKGGTSKYYAYMRINSELINWFTCRNLYQFGRRISNISKITKIFHLHHHQPSVKEFRNHFDNDERALVVRYKIRLATIDTCSYQISDINGALTIGYIDAIGCGNIARAFYLEKEISTNPYHRSILINLCTLSSLRSADETLCFFKSNFHGSHLLKTAKLVVVCKFQTCLHEAISLLTADLNEKSDYEIYVYFDVLDNAPSICDQTFLFYTCNVVIEFCLQFVCNLFCN